MGFPQDSNDIWIPNTLNVGIIDPSLQNHPDFALRRNACANVLNGIAMNTTGIAKRPGTRKTGIELQYDQYDFTWFDYTVSDTERFAIAFGIRKDSPHVIRIRILRVTLNGFVEEISSIASGDPFFPSGVLVDPREISMTSNGNVIVFSHKNMPMHELVYSASNGNQTFSLSVMTLVNPPMAKLHDDPNDSAELSRLKERFPNQIVAIPETSGRVEFRPKSSTTGLSNRDSFPDGKNPSTGDENDKEVIESYNAVTRGTYVRTDGINAAEVINFAYSDDGAGVTEDEKPDGVRPFEQPPGIYRVLYGPEAGYPSEAQFYDDRLWLSNVAGAAGTIHNSFKGRFFDYTRFRAITQRIPNTFDVSGLQQYVPSAGEFQPDFREIYNVGAGRQITSMIDFNGFAARTSEAWYRLSLENFAANAPRVLKKTFQSGGPVGLEPVLLEDAVIDYDRNEKSLYYFYFVGEEEGYRRVDLSVGLNQDLIQQGEILKMTKFHLRSLASIILMLQEMPDGTRRVLCFTFHISSQPDSSVFAFTKFDFPGGNVVDFFSVGDDSLFLVVERNNRTFLEIFDRDVYVDAANDPRTNLITPTGAGIDTDFVDAELRTAVSRATAVTNNLPFRGTFDVNQEIQNPEDDYTMLLDYGLGGGSARSSSINSRVALGEIPKAQYETRDSSPAYTNGTRYSLVCKVLDLERATTGDTIVCGMHDDYLGETGFGSNTADSAFFRLGIRQSGEFFADSGGGSSNAVANLGINVPASGDFGLGVSLEKVALPVLTNPSTLQNIDLFVEGTFAVSKTAQEIRDANNLPITLTIDGQTISGTITADPIVEENIPTVFSIYTGQLTGGAFAAGETVTISSITLGDTVREANVNVTLDDNARLQDHEIIIGTDRFVVTFQNTGGAVTDPVMILVGPSDVSIAQVQLLRGATVQTARLVRIASRIDAGDSDAFLTRTFSGSFTLPASGSLPERIVSIDNGVLTQGAISFRVTGVFISGTVTITDFGEHVVGISDLANASTESAIYTRIFINGALQRSFYLPYSSKFAYANNSPITAHASRTAPQFFAGFGDFTNVLTKLTIGEVSAQDYPQSFYERHSSPQVLSLDEFKAQFPESGSAISNPFAFNITGVDVDFLGEQNCISSFHTVFDYEKGHNSKLISVNVNLNNSVRQLFVARQESATSGSTITDKIFVSSPLLGVDEIEYTVASYPSSESPSQKVTVSFAIYSSCDNNVTLSVSLNGSVIASRFTAASFNINDFRVESIDFAGLPDTASSNYRVGSLNVFALAGFGQFLGKFLQDALTRRSEETGAVGSSFGTDSYEAFLPLLPAANYAEVPFEMRIDALPPFLQQAYQWDSLKKTFGRPLVSVDGDPARLVPATFAHVNFERGGRAIPFDLGNTRPQGPVGENQLAIMQPGANAELTYDPSVQSEVYFRDRLNRQGLTIRHNGNSPFVVYNILYLIQAQGWDIGLLVRAIRSLGFGPRRLR